MIFGVFNVTMSMKGVDFMLCQFSFKNFKSYKDETVFDMQAANLPEFAENIIDCKPASSLLPVAAIYGPNGGGKTNMLQALTCLISTVVKPIYDMEKTRTKLIVCLLYTSDAADE